MRWPDILWLNSAQSHSSEQRYIMLQTEKYVKSVFVGFDLWSFGESYLEAKGLLPMRKDASICMIEASWNKHGRKTVFFLALLSLQKPVNWLSDMSRQVQFSALDAWVISISFITPRSLVNYGANWVLTKQVEQLWAINVIWLIFFYIPTEHR